MRFGTASFMSAFAITYLMSLVPCSSAAAQTATAPTQTSSPDAPAAEKSWWFQIDNKKGLVTVQDKEEKYLFAQVSTTPNLRILFSKPAKSSVISLSVTDDNKKQLWATTISFVGRGRVQMNASDKQGEQTGFSLAVSQTGPAEEEDGEEDSFASGSIQGKITLGANNKPLYMDIRDGKGTGARIETIGEKMVMSRYENGKKAELGSVSSAEGKQEYKVQLDGKEYGVSETSKDTLAVKDADGAFTIRSFERDGKTFTEIVIGKRRIVFEGKSYEMKYDDGGTQVNVKQPEPSKATP